MSFAQMLRVPDMTKSYPCLGRRVERAEASQASGLFELGGVNGPFEKAIADVEREAMPSQRRGRWNHARSTQLCKQVLLEHLILNRKHQRIPNNPFDVGRAFQESCTEKAFGKVSQIKSMM